MTPITLDSWHHGGTSARTFFWVHARYHLMKYDLLCPRVFCQTPLECCLSVQKEDTVDPTPGSTKGLLITNLVLKHIQRTYISRSPSLFLAWGE